MSLTRKATAAAKKPGSPMRHDLAAALAQREADLAEARLGQVLMAERRHQEALESFEAAKRFAGGSDSVFIYDAYLATAELALGQLAEATAMARLSLSEFPPRSGRAGGAPGSR